MHVVFMLSQTKKGLMASHLSRHHNSALNASAFSQMRYITQHNASKHSYALEFVALVRHAA